MSPSHIWTRSTTSRARVAVTCAVLTVTLTGGGPLFAQEIDSVPSIAVQATKKALLDPTTYVPAGLLYTSSRLDWNSSQPLLRNGSLEENARYTVSGLPRDVAISYEEGNHRLMMDALGVLPISFANNALERFTVGVLVAHDPNHRKLWVALGWIERMAFASSLSYMLSARHFEQWQANKQRSAQLGF